MLQICAVSATAVGAGTEQVARSMAEGHTLLMPVRLRPSCTCYNDVRDLAYVLCAAHTCTGTCDSCFCPGVLSPLVYSTRPIVMLCVRVPRGRVAVSMAGSRALALMP